MLYCIHDLKADPLLHPLIVGKGRRIKINYRAVVPVMLNDLLHDLMKVPAVLVIFEFFDNQQKRVHTVWT